MKRSKSFRTKTLRLLPLENAIFDGACEALNGMERTQLMQEGIIFEAARLGVRWTAEPPPPAPSPWAYLPDRGDEPTGVRVSITVSLSVAELISRAAAEVPVSAKGESLLSPAGGSEGECGEPRFLGGPEGPARCRGASPVSS